MIAAEDLTHRYGETAALDGVSLAIDDGEFVVIAGANGSGKTTLVRHFNGLLSPDEGEVRVDGESVEDNPVLARTTVGMVFQNPRDCFVAATVGEDVAFGPENLGLPREEIESRVATALEAVDMADQRAARIDQLSGGEQARVAIAGALAMDPDHLVLDEPFTGLDWPAQKAVLERLDELAAAGTSIVVVTHGLRDLLERADRVVALSAGRIAFDEPPEQARDRLADADIRPC
ncbi:ABC transporter ATP-binding protein [Natronomonas halophila]|uniref:energy-coupling factor ABC transporter ATP-binding protein n=1 Tax=Natronomonas halophila TaxID=2747817 RepID=UPI0015B4B4AB|nr:ABC transporter ATP-binding protein [Natronomonas halophila]QLD85400.1 ABC transporter ATP-binding protein [Natronomonas halophila]